MDAPKDKQIAAGEKPLKSEVPVAKTSRQKKFDDDINKSLQEGKITQQEADVMKQYNDAVPNGKLSVDDIKKKLDNGEEFNPQTKRFGNSSNKGKGKSNREEYVGSTPGKRSRTGREVMDRMYNEKPSRIRNYPPLNKNTKFFDAFENDWFPISEADMGHSRLDAVDFWNQGDPKKGIPPGRELGPKHPEVRKWMLDSDNYELQHFSNNKSKGASSGKNYLDPI